MNALQFKKLQNTNVFAKCFKDWGIGNIPKKYLLVSTTKSNILSNKRHCFSRCSFSTPISKPGKSVFKSTYQTD